MTPACMRIFTVMVHRSSPHQKPKFIQSFLDEYIIEGHIPASHESQGTAFYRCHLFLFLGHQKWNFQGGYFRKTASKELMNSPFCFAPCQVLCSLLHRMTTLSFSCRAQFTYVGHVCGLFLQASHGFGTQLRAHHIVQTIAQPILLQCSGMGFGLTLPLPLLEFPIQSSNGLRFPFFPRHLN